MKKRKILLMLSTLFTVSNAEVIKGPYLLYDDCQRSMSSYNTTSMNVLWQVDQIGTQTIHWGTTRSYEAGSAQISSYTSGSGYLYKKQITGLRPNTKYYYKVDNVGTGSFITRPTEQVDSVKFFAFGDTRSQPKTYDMVSKSIMESYKEEPELQSLALIAGDLVGYGADETCWRDEYFNRSYSNIKVLQSELPIIPSIGNHELNSKTGSSTDKTFRKYFPAPKGNNGSSSDYYWSVNYGPVHIINLNVKSEHDYSHEAAQRERQRVWLENDLAQNSKPWTIVMTHAPAYTVGGAHKGSQHLRDLLKGKNVDLVISGHNHIYCRSEVDDVQHIITGGAGAPLYKSAIPNPQVSAYESQYHFLEIKATGDKLSVKVRRASDRSIIESFIIDDNGNLIETESPLHQLLFNN